MRTAFMHWLWVFLVLCLTGCQHIQLAKSPLPVKLIDGAQPPSNLPAKQSAATNKPTLPQKNRPVPPNTAEVRTDIFLLEDWF